MLTYHYTHKKTPLILFNLVVYQRAQIGETTEALNHVEGDLTIIQDRNSDASKELNTLEREARELNLTSEQLKHQLDILKNSNFLGGMKPSSDETVVFSISNMYPN